MAVTRMISLEQRIEFACDADKRTRNPIRSLMLAGNLTAERAAQAARPVDPAPPAGRPHDGAGPDPKLSNSTTGEK